MKKPPTLELGQMPLTSFNLQALQRVTDWLLPERCLGCQKVVSSGSAFCPECYSSLPFQPDACVRCGQVYAGVGIFCGRCIANPPPQDTTFYPFSYTSPISDCIQKLKYSERPEYARRLATLLAAEIIAAGIEMPELLVPVPMHLNRLRMRGYNQAAELCKYLAKALNIPYDTHLLKKISNTPPQVEMTLNQRQKNVQRSFTIKNDLQHQHIAVVDDVFTTGATAGEACKVLKKAGAETLQVWTLAHTL